MSVDGTNVISRSAGTANVSTFNNNAGNLAKYKNSLQTDELELSTKPAKKPMSKAAKFAIAAGVLLAAIGIGFWSKKQIDARKLVKLPENIEFKKGETLDEAIKFGADVLGIKKYTGFTEADLDVVNWANQGLVHVNNAAKGKAIMPKKIVYESLGKDKSGGLLGGTMSGGGTLSISKDYIQSVKNVVKSLINKNDHAQLLNEANQEKNFSLWMDYFILLLKANRNVESVQKVIKQNHSSVWSIINHEMGHWQHRHNVNVDLYNLLGKSQERTAYLDERKGLLSFLRPKAEIIEESSKLQELFEKSKDIAGKVSEYAKASPDEFVAECYAKMVDGIKLPADVMELYKKLGGVVT